MANNRFKLKQFAGNASNNGVFGSYSAGTSETSSDPATIQSLPAWLNGWLDATTSASILPRLEEMQGLQYVLCKSLIENYKEGIPTWSAEEEYYKYSICAHYDYLFGFDIYINMTGQYTENSPPLDILNWSSFTSFYINKIIPSQLGQDGKFLSTDGMTMKWTFVPTLPDLTGNAGKFLSTDGTTTSWSNIDLSSKANVAMDNVTNAGKQTINDWGMPDYTAGVTITHGTTYQAVKNLLFCYSCNSAEYALSSIQISQNGSTWIELGRHYTVGGGGDDQENVGQVFVPRGWYYRATGGGSSLCVAYPLIGG